MQLVPPSRASSREASYTLEFGLRPCRAALSAYLRPHLDTPRLLVSPYGRFGAEQPSLASIIVVLNIVPHYCRKSYYLHAKYVRGPDRDRNY